ncbi:MAG: tetratricopeptide repeat protein [Acidobacteriota bacterium]
MASAHQSLASLRHASGKAEDAIRALNTAIALQPSSLEAHRLLARILAERGRIDEAIAELQHAIALGPDAWSTHYALAFVYYNAGQYEKALPPLRRVTELQPDFASTYSLLGAVHHRLGEIPRAVGYYEHAVRVGANAAALANLGTIYYAAGRFRESLDAFLKAIAIDATSAGLRRNAGDAYVRLGDRRQATAMYEQAVTLNKERLALNERDAAALALLALCEAKLGRRAEAVEHAAQAVVLAPEDREVLYKQAAVHALVHDAPVALDALRRAIDRGYEPWLAREDDDLASLRTSPAFDRLTVERSTTERSR